MSDLNDINEEEVFEKKESKFKPYFEKYSKNKKIIVVFIIGIIILLCTILIYLGIIPNSLNMGKTGNTMGNILNCGYAVEKDDSIYYVSPSDDMKSTNINRVKAGESEGEVIYAGNYDIRGLNIVGNKLYFINLSKENVSDDDEVDNKICKMNLDGSGLTVINDNEFAYDSYNMYVANNNIYYVGEDQNVYQMNLNGGNRKLVVDSGTGYLAMSNKYIIFNRDNELGNDYITYIREINGTEEREITSSRIHSPMIYEDNIYYINENNHLAKINVNGGDEEELTNFTVYNMNLYDGNIYYLNYKDEENQDYTVSIYKLSMNGGDAEVIKDLSNYSSFLNIVNNYAYYMDMDDEKAFINLVNINDLSEINLHEWSYNKNE